MGFWRRFFNAISADPGGTDTIDLNEARLLEWLGIDSDKPKEISEITYFTCLKVLSETMGKLPLKYYREEETGGRVREPPTAAGRLLMNRPNPAMTPATFWSTVESNCEHYGNSYVWIQSDFQRQRYGGDYTVRAFWPMQSDAVQVTMDDAGIFGNAGRLYYEYTDPRTGKQYVFRQSEVLHFKSWLTWDGIIGKSVRDILKTTVIGSAQAQRYLDKLYESGLTASSVLQYTGDLDEQKRRRLQKKYNDLLSGAKNAGKVVALPVGMQLQPLSYKLADSQFAELKKYSALQIAAAFGVKPNQINNYDKSSYANSEMQQLAFLVDTMLYRITAYEQEINSKLLSTREETAGCFYKFNERVLLRTNFEAQIKAIAQGIQNGIYTPNEGRHYLDLPSQAGGDQLIVNGNYVPLTAVGAAYGVGQKGGDGDGNQG